MTAAGYEVSIHGFVQGQGVRPALARLAERRQWTGDVRNTPRGVLLRLAGVGESAAEVESLIRGAHPALANATVTLRPCEACGASGFCIVESDANGPSAVPVPRDTAVCAECLQEFHNEPDQRHRFALISCTRCGPRFSVVRAMPYDRGRATLDEFPPCPDCQRDYDARDGRRRHAQTIGCPNCGPQLWAADRHRRTIAARDAACEVAARALDQGKIVALRGIGGYQLLVDATNEAAVRELRRRKRRASKPFAVLSRTLDDAAALAVLDGRARDVLTSPANPIVIAPRRFETALASDIHPRLGEIGLMLPTTAVHDRLLQLVGRPLVCTSGNLEGAPLAVTIDDAHDSLAEIADLWLHHDRPIAHPLDDSVVRMIAGRAVTLRCARGLAPLPLELPAAPPIVALGGYQKAALAWSNGAQAALGPHIGELNDLSTRERWRQHLAAMSALYGLDSCTWAVDSHPDDVARRSIPSGAKSLGIWHHHAHIVAGMLEHGWLDRPVLGIAGDGQGYGPDGTLWGGEVLWTTARGFRRVAALRPYALPGGEAAVLDPRRVAVALLSQLPEISPVETERLARCDHSQLRVLRQALRSAITPRTSSLGRLFDGVAWLVLGLESAGHIGEPAVLLEAACDSRAMGRYNWDIDTDCEPWHIDWRPMLRQLLDDVRRDESPGVIAERFHRSVAGWMRAVHRLCPPAPLVVGGGVFQNRRLCELLAEDWPTAAPPLGLPGAIPPNDGGLAAGQLAIAASVPDAGR
jgi:hydrogenase maturation protein HypF